MWLSISQVERHRRSMASSGSPMKKPRLAKEELQNLTKEELLQRYEEQEAFIEQLISKQNSDQEVTGLRESEERLKQQQVEAARRENVLVMRLTTKEQEMQEYLNQIQELKQSQNVSTRQLRSTLLDPAINLMFQRMKKEMEVCKEKHEQAQNDLAAWKFTPDSQTGKRLMAKCRMLLQENEELGKQISSGRMAKLEGEIALEKELVKEMKKSQAEMDEFLLELDEGSEGMQGTIILLQQELKEAKDQITQLQQEIEELRAARNNEGPASPTTMETDDTEQQTSNQPEAPSDWGASHGSSRNYSETSHVSENTNGHRDSQGDEMETDSEPVRTEASGATIEEYRTSGEKHNGEHAGYRTPEAVETTDASSEAWSPKESKQSVVASTIDSSEGGEKPAKHVYRTESQEDGLQNGSAGSPGSISQESHEET